MLKSLIIATVLSLTSLGWSQGIATPNQTGPIIKPTAFEPYIQPPSPALAGLWINTNAGIVWLGGLPTTITSARVHLQASATNYVYVNLQTNTVQVNTTGFGSSIYPVAIVSTNNTQTTTVQDVRPDVYGTGGGGGGGGPAVLVNGVSTSDQTTLNLTDASGIHWANPSGGVVTAAVTGNISVSTITLPLPSDTGTTNVYAACPSPTPTLGKGLQIQFNPANSNTGASTFSLCGGLAIAIQRPGAAALIQNDIRASSPTTITYDGTFWQDASPSSGGVVSFNGRTGTVSPVLTDYQGMTQSGSGGTLNILTNSSGTLFLGNSSSAAGSSLTLNPSSSFVGFFLIDSKGDYIAGENGGAGFPGVQIDVGNGTGTTTNWNATDIVFSAAVGGQFLDMNASQAAFNIPVNFGASIPFLIGGSPGTPGQCVVTNGTTPAWGSCATASVSTVSGTPGQILSTGGSNPVISLASPLTPPGNIIGTQSGNGNTLFTHTRSTDVSPSGNYDTYNTAGGTTIAKLDVLGNFTGNSFNANGTGGGLIYWTQGADNSVNCPVNSICREAPASVGTSYTITSPGTAPSVASVVTHAPVSGSVVTESETPATGTGGFIQSAVASSQSAPNNTVATLDGSGNIKSSGTLISALLPTCNSATVSIVPICGHVDSLGLTGNLANTNILSGTVQPGLYQLSVYLNETANPCSVVGGGQFVARIAYTDSNGAVTRTAGTLTFSTGATTQQPAVISLWIQSATSTINVSGLYTACGTPAGGGAFTLDAHYSLARVE